MAKVGRPSKNEKDKKTTREVLLEDIFSDFYRKRRKVDMFNFFRGVFFGLGSVLGGTIVVALIIWLLNSIGLLVPAMAEFINSIVHLLN